MIMKKMIPQKAYCTFCKEITEVFWDTECDESGVLYDIPYCLICQTEIQKCNNCKHWIPDDPNTPLGETNGTCKLKEDKIRVHAMDLICESFDEWERKIEKPKLPCGECKEVCTGPDGKIGSCEQYIEFRKKLGKWYEDHPEELTIES